MNNSNPIKPEPIFLRAADVKAKARKAFLRGRLQAQQDPEGDGCAYTGPCAIGVSLTPRQRARLDDFDDSSIEGLIKAGVVKTDSPRTLIALQANHDNRRFARLRRMLGVPAAAKPRST